MFFVLLMEYLSEMQATTVYFSLTILSRDIGGMGDSRRVEKR